MKKVVFIFLIVTMAVAAGCATSNTNNEANTLDAVPAEYAGLSNPFGSEAAADGAEVFKSSCQTCHGEAGKGDGPASSALNPKPKDLAELQAVVEDDYLFWRISTGKDGTAMIAWKGILSDEQIWQVVAFIRTLK